MEKGEASVFCRLGMDMILACVLRPYQNNHRTIEERAQKLLYRSGQLLVRISS